MPASHDPLLEIRDLHVSFHMPAGVLCVVDGVSLSVEGGRTVAIVGESGCGKSVTALSILRLLPEPPAQIEGGAIHFWPGATAPLAVQRSNQPGAARASRHQAVTADEPVDLLTIDDRQMRRIRGNRIAMIFQDPMTSLNPVYTVGEQIVEALELHQALRGKAAWAHAVDMLRTVGIPAAETRARDYPHRMSGGMLQRVMIAMALACRPALLIADEPTTALDATVQVQILELLHGVQQQTHMGILLVTHDFSVVAKVADYVYVMYAGRIVEHAPADLLLKSPLHPYTQGLLSCVPRLVHRPERLEAIPGRLPDPAHWPGGCRFHARCRTSAARAADPGRTAVSVETAIGRAVLRRCFQAYDQEPSGDPALRELRPGHFVACWEAG